MANLVIRLKIDIFLLLESDERFVALQFMIILSKFDNQAEHLL